MLAALDPDKRQRADRLHNLVNKPDTQQYLQSTHQVDHGQFAKDASGAIQLQSDWSLPYVANERRVQFNHHIHSTIDLGVSDV